MIAVLNVSCKSKAIDLEADRGDTDTGKLLHAATMGVVVNVIGTTGADLVLAKVKVKTENLTTRES